MTPKITQPVKHDDAPTGGCLHEKFTKWAMLWCQLVLLRARRRRRWPPAAGDSGAKRKKGDTADDVIPRGFCFCTKMFTKIYMWLFDLVVGRMHGNSL